MLLYPLQPWVWAQTRTLTRFCLGFKQAFWQGLGQGFSQISGQSLGNFGCTQGFGQWLRQGLYKGMSKGSGKGLKKGLDKDSSRVWAGQELRQCARAWIQFRSPYKVIIQAQQLVLVVLSQHWVTPLQDMECHRPTNLEHYHVTCSHWLMMQSVTSYIYHPGTGPGVCCCW